MRVDHTEWNIILDEQCQRLQEPELPRADPGGVPGVLRPGRLQQDQPPGQQLLQPPRHLHHHHHAHWRDTLTYNSTT